MVPPLIESWGKSSVLCSWWHECLSVFQNRGPLFIDNEAEYEMLIIALISALYAGIYKLHAQEDSRLIIKQVNGELAPKEIPFAFYQAVVQKLVRFFSSIRFEHYREYADALAAVASKVNVFDKAVDMSLWRDLIHIADLVLANSFDEQD